MIEGVGYGKEENLQLVDITMHERRGSLRGVVSMFELIHF